MKKTLKIFAIFYRGSGSVVGCFIVMRDICTHLSQIAELQTVLVLSMRPFCCFVVVIDSCAPTDLLGLLCVDRKL